MHCPLTPKKFSSSVEVVHRPILIDCLHSTEIPIEGMIVLGFEIDVGVASADLQSRVQLY